jgi:hypothetical protein
VIASISQAGPLIWRSAKTIPAGKPIIQLNIGYHLVNKSYNWTDEEWTDIPDNNQTTVVGAHFMLGYAPVKQLEVMTHVPLAYKSKDTLSNMGWSDIWLKTRYNFIGGKGKPFITGVLGARLPVAKEVESGPSLGDRSLDIGAGAIYFQKFSSILVHFRIAYWYNMTKETTGGDINIGDDIEILFKPEYMFSKQLKVFVSGILIETMKSKDANGNEIDNSQKRRLNLTPGLVYSPVPGLKIRPKLVYPLDMVGYGGSLFTWKIGLDFWYIAK